MGEGDQLMHVPLVHMNITAFGHVFSAKKFPEAARIVAVEESHEDGGWHPIGNFLACHSELSLMAFLRMNGNPRTRSK